MHSFSSIIARRSIDLAQDTYKTMGSNNKDGDEQPKASPLIILLVAITLIVFSVVLLAASYTYGHLIPALAMIESPETNAYVPVDSLDSDEADPSQPPAYTSTPGTPKPSDPRSVDPDVLLVKNKPITSSIRGTLAHLRARGGFKSRFRGLGIFWVWAFSRGFVGGILSSLPGLRNPFGVMLTRILAETALSTFHLTWIWIVISDPSPLPWYKRLPPLRRAFPRIAPAILVQATTVQIALTLPVLMCYSWGPLRRFGTHSQLPVEKAELTHAFFQSIFFITSTLALFVLLCIPATVTLTRVAASMLPDADETIVPFDRSFGGKVTPAILGGQGKIGMVEAWRSFGWNQRKNLLKVVAKGTAIIFGVYILFAMILAAEMAMGGEGMRHLFAGLNGMK